MPNPSSTPTSALSATAPTASSKKVLFSLPSKPSLPSNRDPNHRQRHQRSYYTDVHHHNPNPTRPNPHNPDPNPNPSSKPTSKCDGNDNVIKEGMGPSYLNPTLGPGPRPDRNPYYHSLPHPNSNPSLKPASAPSATAPTTSIKDGTQNPSLIMILTLPDPTLILTLTVNPTLTPTLTRARSLHQRQARRHRQHPSRKGPAALTITLIFSLTVTLILTYHDLDQTLTLTYQEPDQTLARRVLTPLDSDA